MTTPNLPTIDGCGRCGLPADGHDGSLASQSASGLMHHYVGPDPDQRNYRLSLRAGSFALGEKIDIDGEFGYEVQSCTHTAATLPAWQVCALDPETGISYHISSERVSRTIPKPKPKYSVGDSIWVLGTVEIVHPNTGHLGVSSVLGFNWVSPTSSDILDPDEL